MSNSKWFAIQSHQTGELYSLKLCVIVHDNPNELGWLITNAKVVSMKGETPYDVANWLGRRVMLLKDHPDLSHVRWPLVKNDFWDQEQRQLSALEVRRAAWQSLSQT